MAVNISVFARVPPRNLHLMISSRPTHLGNTTYTVGTSITRIGWEREKRKFELMKKLYFTIRATRKDLFLYFIRLDMYNV